jgi:hypothetical protein
MTTCITLHSDRFTWRLAALCSPLFQFAVSRGPRVKVQCIAVNIVCLVIIFEDGAGNVFLRPADTRHRQVIYWYARFYQLNEPTGNNVHVGANGKIIVWIVNLTVHRGNQLWRGSLVCSNCVTDWTTARRTYVSGNNFAHLQEHYTLQCSLWYVAPSCCPKRVELIWIYQ